MISRASRVPLLAQAQRRKERTAVVDSQGLFTYNDLLDASSHVAMSLLAGQKDLHEERVAFLVTPGFPWIATQWGIWRAGGVAVPLPLGSPRPELEYFIDDSQATTLVFEPLTAPLVSLIAAARGIRALSYDQLAACQQAELPDISPERRAMILYTSGTTSRPKGVVTTHSTIAAQVMSLVEAWEWSADDRIVLCLPLHHVHGIINVVSCSLWSGATCQMLPRFDANATWDAIAGGGVTVFMAVPTIYAKLVSAWDAASPERRVHLSEACARLRLMVSGSAALPVSTLQRWKEITGHTLLERYGMTEIGMALSNPLRGERVPGSVGTPLPSVEVQLVGENAQPVGPGTAGEIEVRGPSVFAEYWRKPTQHAMPFAMAGFALAILRSSRMVSIAFLAERILTSSRRADIRCPRWRLRKHYAHILRLPSVPLSACRIQSGASAWLQPWC
jgi:malonyl-CoA/methylmalonyl-CoA synthetase